MKNRYDGLDIDITFVDLYKNKSVSELFELCKLHTQPENKINEKATDGKIYILTEKYTTFIEIDRYIFGFNVPKNFTYDGASIPRYCWSLLGLTPDGLMRAASTVHDFIYRFRGHIPYGSLVVFDKKKKRMLTDRELKDFSISKMNADAVLREIMKRSGISGIQRWATWTGVFLLGYFSWKK